MNELILEARNLSKTYASITVLKKVNFALRKGEVHALVGENGAGKSTLIKLLAGVISPDPGGEIWFDGNHIPKMTPEKSTGLGVSVIFQDISLFPDITVAENICLSNANTKVVNWKDMHKTAADLLKRLDIQIDPGIQLSELSTGQQQLVAIVRAINQNSKVIIMDEPTAALSKGDAEKLFRIIESLKGKIAVVYISHKLEEIFRVADRITVLRDGELVASGNVDEFDTEKMISLMVGRELRFIPMHNEKGSSDEVIFKARNLSNEKYFQDVSFEVRKHEVLGITGLVGAGRTELALSIFGIYKHMQGEMWLDGKPYKSRSANNAINSGIAYITEDRRTLGLFMGHSMIMNITAATLNRVINRFGFLRKKEEKETTDRYIEAFSIRPNLPEIPVMSLSGGNQQKVLLSKWMNSKPRLMIVDEPTSGVDVGAKIEIHKMLRSLADEGVGVILISSDLSEILALSDRVLVMRQGKLVDELDAKEATQERILEKGLLG